MEEVSVSVMLPRHQEIRMGTLTQWTGS